MSSVILRTATIYMQPILLMFSMFLLLGGHNEPGGGFTGGLIAASSFVLYAIAFGAPHAQRMLHVHPTVVIGAGLLLAAGSALPSLLFGKPFMTGLWGEIFVPGLGAVPIGTPLFFDMGVYLVVIGITVLIIFSMVEES
jgi:multicomponent Na+:H+ antiporter subunit B